jgi:hypothetical protein
MRLLRWFVVGLSLVALARPAAARQEAADLKREIDAQRAAVIDLERLDERHAVTDETTLLRAWLDEAGAQFGKEDFDKVREVLDRCIAQAEQIRQRIAATRLTQHAVERENALKRLRDKIDQTRVSLQQATINKKALELNAK